MNPPNLQDRAQQRQHSEQKFHDLLGGIRDSLHAAIRAGSQPTEVWLGPKEARVFEAEMQHQQEEGRLRFLRENTDALLSADMEGAQIMGLRVRLMAKDGLRVGLSWPRP